MNAAPVGSENEESRRFPYFRRNLQVLPVATLLAALGFSIAFPFLPLMVRSLGVHEHLETWVGYMMLAFYIIGFIANPIWGGIADHYGRKIMVLRAMLGMGFFMALIPFAQTPLWFAGLFMLVGIFNGSNAAVTALVVGNTPHNRIGSALAMTHSGALLGQTMGPAVGALLAAFVAQRHWLFWISGGLLFSGGLLVAFLVREVKQPVAGQWRPNWVGDLRELLAVPRMGPLYFLCSMFTVMWGGNVTIITIYSLQLIAAQPADAGADAYWAGAAAMALAISGVVALPIWGRMLDRSDAARILAFATAGAALSTLLLVILQTPLQLVISRLIFGFAAAGMQPAIMRLLKEHAPVGMDARAISYATSFQYIAAGLAPFTAGLIGPTLGLRCYFALTAALVGGGLLLWLRSGTRRS